MVGVQLQANPWEWFIERFIQMLNHAWNGSLYAHVGGICWPGMADSIIGLNYLSNFPMEWLEIRATALW
jgi:hypothetical protein